MRRELVISSTPEETRIAILEDGRTAEILIERGGVGVAGNIYLGRVDRILPGMQSAFIDVGLERHAFLHASDVVEGEADADRTGDDAASQRRIEKLLKEGDAVLVQVSREPIGSKGARVTTHVTLPGRLLVFMPSSSHLGVSKRLSDEAERERLRGMLVALQAEEPGGYIVRTAAVGRSLDELRGEARRLRGAWEELRDIAAAATPPALVRAEQPPHLKVLRDLDLDHLERIVVDDEDVERRVSSWLREVAPERIDLVARDDHPEPLLERLGVEQDIEKALRERVWLKSGGYLVINQMEALVAIDVNTGKFTGSKGLEETALKTNLEAAAEVSRQLRLRDLGGIVVVDFIDLEDAGNRRQVLERLEEGLAADRAKITVAGMNAFGLVAITRQRQRRSLQRTLTESCAECGGSGRVKSVETIVAQVLRQAREALESGRGAGRPAALRVRCHPHVAAGLRERLAALEARGEGLSLSVEDDRSRHRETFDLLS